MRFAPTPVGRIIFSFPEVREVLKIGLTVVDVMTVRRLDVPGGSKIQACGNLRF